MGVSLSHRYFSLSLPLPLSSSLSKSIEEMSSGEDRKKRHLKEIHVYSDPYRTELSINNLANSEGWLRIRASRRSPNLNQRTGWGGHSVTLRDP